MCGNPSSRVARRHVVAKATILICDCCRTQQPAVGTLDLCAKHIKAARALRNEKPAAEPTKQKRNTWSKPDRDAISEKILEFADARPMFTGAEVARHMNRTPFIVREAITQLVKAGKLASTGEGAGRKLSKAS
jgi:predicted HTH transcriptional regulator